MLSLLARQVWPLSGMESANDLAMSQHIVLLVLLAFPPIFWVKVRMRMGIKGSVSICVLPCIPVAETSRFSTSQSKIIINMHATRPLKKISLRPVAKYASVNSS